MAVPAAEAPRDLAPPGAQLPLQRDQLLVVLKRPAQLLLGLIEVVDPPLSALLAAALLDLEVLPHQPGDERPVLAAVLAHQLREYVVFLNDRNVYVVAPFVVPMIHAELNNLLYRIQGIPAI